MVVRFLTYSRNHLLIFLGLIFIYGCHDNEKTKPIVLNPLIIADVDTTYFYIDSITRDSSSLRSKLVEEVSKLSELDGKYQLLKTGRIKKESSLIYRAILEKPELCRSAKNCYKIENFSSFNKSIHSVNYALLEGKVWKDINALPIKVQVEEIIFYNKSNPQVLLDYINYLRTIEYFWNTIDKSSVDIIVLQNKLYLIRTKTRGKKAFIREICKKIKE